MIDKIEDAADRDTNSMLIPTLKNAAKKYHDKAATHRAKAEQEEQRKKDKRYAEKSAGQWKLCKDMQNNFAAPLVAVKRDQTGPQGQAKGTIATAPKEVDAILRKALAKIYDGNAADQEKTTKEYMEHYGKYIFKQKTAKITPLSGKDLQITADEMRESAAGLDNWAPADLKMLPPSRTRNWRYF